MSRDVDIVHRIEPAPLVTGRTCGTCTMCCKLLLVVALDKPCGTWCPHVLPGGRGCGIYATRPDECASYQCAWLQGNFADDERPDRSGVVAGVEDTPQGPVARFAEYRPGATARGKWPARITDMARSTTLRAVVVVDAVGTVLRIARP